MRLVYLLDDDGFYTHPEFVHDLDGLGIPLDRITDIPPPDFIRAKFVNGQWIEGADDEYLDSLKPGEAEPSALDFIAEQNAFLTEELATAQSVNKDLAEMNAFLTDQMADTQATVRLLAEQQANMLLMLSELQSPPNDEPLPDDKPEEESPVEEDPTPIPEEGGNE